MTVRLAQEVKYYVGTSADTKPTSDGGANSRFYETDTNDRYIFDGSSWYLSEDWTIGYLHSMGHKGQLFSASYYQALVSRTTNLDILIITASGYNFHMGYALDSSGDGQTTVYEEPTVTASGTPITAYNKNRTSTNTLNASIYYSPTTSGGTQLKTNYERTYVRSEGSLLSEWILDDNKSYLIRYTPDTDQQVSFVIEGYEKEA